MKQEFIGRVIINRKPVVRVRPVLSEEAQHSITLGRLHGRETATLKYAGDKELMEKSKQNAKIRRKRVRLRETVAAEARQIQELARQMTVAAMKRIGEIAANSPNETAAIAAGALLFDRAYGKANQTNINASLDANGKSTDVSQKELDTRIEETLKRIDALTGGEAKASARKKQPPDLRQFDRDPDSSSVH